MGIKKDYGDGIRYKWRCNKRNYKCPARVTQIDTEFFLDEPHSCQPDPSLRVSVPIYAQAKKAAIENVFKPASEIVEPLTYSSYKKLSKKSRHYIPKVSNVVQSTNRARASLRPATPKSVHFEFSRKHLPKGFVKKPIDWTDSKGVDQRIVILTTKRQLKKLARAKRWEVDATFDVVSDPFYQLFGIHTSVRKGAQVKSIPLVSYVLQDKDCLH